MLVTLIVGGGAPLFAMPSAGQLTLILELTAFGFVAALGISMRRASNKEIDAYEQE